MPLAHQRRITAASCISVMLVIALLTGLFLPRGGFASAMSDDHCAGMAMIESGASDDAGGAADESRCAFPCTVLPAGVQFDIDLRVQDCPGSAADLALDHHARPPLQPPRA